MTGQRADHGSLQLPPKLANLAHMCWAAPLVNSVSAAHEQRACIDRQQHHAAEYDCCRVQDNGAELVSKTGPPKSPGQCTAGWVARAALPVGVGVGGQ